VRECDRPRQEALFAHKRSVRECDRPRYQADDAYDDAYQADAKTQLIIY
jgi:hypothetical protein